MTDKLTKQERAWLESTRSYSEQIRGGPMGGAILSRYLELIAIIDRLAPKS